MYYVQGRDVRYNSPGASVYSRQSATVKIFSNEEEYMQYQRPRAVEFDPADDW